MGYVFKFIKGRVNVEKFRVNVRDPVNGDNTLNPALLSKIELIAGAIVISSETGEITWDGDVIQIKPNLTTLNIMPQRSHSVLVAYKNDEGTNIGKGVVLVVDYS